MFLSELSSKDISILLRALDTYESELREELRLCRTNLIVPFFNELKDIEEARKVLKEEQ